LLLTHEDICFDNEENSLIYKFHYNQSQINYALIMLKYFYGNSAPIQMDFESEYLYSIPRIAVVHQWCKKTWSSWNPAICGTSDLETVLLFALV
jgi:hypothetical protein